jgi:hypothetical protein
MRDGMNTWVREGGDADRDALEPEERSAIA